MTPSVEFEAVHFDQQLVQRLLAFVVAAAQSSTAMAADRVDFIDEHDARCVLFRLFEHVADTAGANADEHFHKIGAGNRKERHIRFARNGTREQRFAGTGRANEQHAFGDAATKALKFLRVFEEVDDFLEIVFGLVDTCDIFEGYAALTFREQFGARLTEPHRLAAAGLHLAQEEHPHTDQQQHRKPTDQDVQEVECPIVSRLGIEFDVMVEQPLDQARHLRACWSKIAGPTTEYP